MNKMSELDKEYFRNVFLDFGEFLYDNKILQIYAKRYKIDNIYSKNNFITFCYEISVDILTCSEEDYNKINEKLPFLGRYLEGMLINNLVPIDDKELFSEQLADVLLLSFLKYKEKVDI